MRFVITADCFDGKKHLKKGEIVSYEDSKVVEQMKAAGRLADLGTAEALRIQEEDSDTQREKYTLPDGEGHLDTASVAAVNNNDGRTSRTAVSPTGAIAIKRKDAANDVEDFWKPSFETLYDACYYEFASELIITRWSRIHFVTAVLAAATASGSAVSGWALWSNAKGKLWWASIAGLASVFSILHGVLGVPAKIKEEEQRRQHFSALRVDLETFRHSLTTGCDFKNANKTFDSLRERLSSCVSKAPPDLVFTTGARKRVQKKVDENLKRYISG